MPPTYQKYLEQMFAKARKYGFDFQPACSAKDLSALQTRAWKELGIELPQGYADLLRQHDGFAWNGVIIHASKTVPLAGETDHFIEGFIDANLGFRSEAWKKEFVTFGSSDVDLYVYEPSKKQYSTRDRVSLDVNELHASFEEMITAAFRTHV